MGQVKEEDGGVEEEEVKPWEGQTMRNSRQRRAAGAGLGAMGGGGGKVGGGVSENTIGRTLVTLARGDKEGRKERGKENERQRGKEGKMG